MNQEILYDIWAADTLPTHSPNHDPVAVSIVGALCTATLILLLLSL